MTLTESPTVEADEAETEAPNSGGSGPWRDYRLPGDKVREALANVPEEERELCLWLHEFIHATKADQKRLLKKENGTWYSAHSIYALLTGLRSAGPRSNMLKAVRALKELEEKRRHVKAVDFIETEFTRLIFDVCHTARLFQAVKFIYGESHIGKTTALKAYAHGFNHGSTIYVRMPAGGGLGDFIVALATALRISPHGPKCEVKMRIKRAFDSSMLLIVDQAHECFQNPRAQSLPRVLLFIMEIFDETECGVVLAGTQVLQHAMQEGIHKKVLHQLGQRSLGKGLALPAKPPRHTLDEFAAAFLLPPADDTMRVCEARDSSGEMSRWKASALALQTVIIRDFSLGYWLKILRQGARVAANRKEAPAWEHVLIGHSMLKAMDEAFTS